MARMIRAKTVFSALLVIGLAGLTGACASNGWQESYSNKRNTVELVRLTHAVQFAQGAESLSPAERAALEHFLQDTGAGYGDEAWIDAGSDTLGAARAGAIMAALSQHGIIASPDNLAYGAAPQPGEVRLVI